MAKPITAGNASLKRIWFSGNANSTGPKAPQALTLAGSTPRSRMLPMGHPDFGGCRWPIDSDCAEQLFCCAPATGPFCATHTHRGLVPIPPSGRGSAAEFIRGLERFL